MRNRAMMIQPRLTISVTQRLSQSQVNDLVALLFTSVGKCKAFGYQLSDKNISPTLVSEKVGACLFRHLRVCWPLYDLVYNLALPLHSSHRIQEIPAKTAYLYLILRVRCTHHP